MKKDTVVDTVVGNELYENENGDGIAEYGFIKGNGTGDGYSYGSCNLFGNGDGDGCGIRGGCSYGD